MSPAVEDMVGEIAVEIRALSAKAHALEAVLQRPDLLIKLLHVDVDISAAAAAPKATLAAQPSDLAVKLLATLRAGNADLLIVEQAFGLDASAGPDVSTGARDRAVSKSRDLLYSDLAPASEGSSDA